jgi:hypothetical protein
MPTCPLECDEVAPHGHGTDQVYDGVDDEDPTLKPGSLEALLFEAFTAGVNADQERSRGDNYFWGRNWLEGRFAQWRRKRFGT